MSIKQQADFIYWATQYVKMKCIGARPRQIENADGVQIDWTSKQADHSMFWSHVDIVTAFEDGADAIKALIQREFKAAMEPAEGDKQSSL